MKYQKKDHCTQIYIATILNPWLNKNCECNTANTRVTLCLPLGSTCSVWILPSLRIQCIERHGRISEACSLQQILCIERWCYALFACKFHLDLNRKPILTRIQKRNMNTKQFYTDYTQKMGEIRQWHALFWRLRSPLSHLRSPPPTVLLSPWGAPLLCSCCHRSCAAPWFPAFQVFWTDVTCDVIFQKKNTFRWCTCGFSVH